MHHANKKRILFTNRLNGGFSYHCHILRTMKTGKIDVTKIDKNRLFKGEKGTYLDIVLIPTPENQYGDYMIVQSVTKEEKEKGVKGNILGSVKNLKKSDAPKQAETTNEESDDLPF